MTATEPVLHTPGPWSYRSQEHDDWGIVRAATDNRGYSPVICQARDPYCLDGDELAIHRKNKTDPWEANARLIAAAPELLAQLEYAVKLLGAFPALNGTAQVQSMRDTLAKATPQNHLQHKG